MSVPTTDTEDWEDDDEETTWVWTIETLVESGVPRDLLERGIQAGWMTVEDFEGEPAVLDTDYQRWKQFGMSDAAPCRVSLLPDAVSEGARQPTPEDELLWNKDPYLRWAWDHDPDLYAIVATQERFDLLAKRVSRLRKVSDQEARQILHESRRRFRAERHSKADPAVPSTAFGADDARAAREEAQRLRRILESWRE